jgi:hypothetical protein
VNQPAAYAQAQAIAIDRAMRSWVAEHGQGKRLVGTDYVSMKLTLPCTSFLARCVVVGPELHHECTCTGVLLPVSTCKAHPERVLR